MDSELEAMFKTSTAPSDGAPRPLKKSILAQFRDTGIPPKPVSEKKQNPEAPKRKGRAEVSVVPRRENPAVGEEAAEEKGPTAPPSYLNDEEASRTLFLGNVPLLCLQQGKSKAVLENFIKSGAGRLSEAPLQVLSVRFRSVPLEEGKNMPRKVALKTAKMSPTRDTLNAYVKLSSAEDALTLCSLLNGQFFMGKHLRVSVANEKPVFDSERTVFVGNLPFQLEEEQLYAFFESLALRASGIRVVRDRDSGSSKGFAYVLLESQEAVKRALKIHKGRLLFEKRQLRLMACRATTEKKPSSAGGAKKARHQPSSSSSPLQNRAAKRAKLFPRAS